MTPRWLNALVVAAIFAAGLVTGSLGSVRLAQGRVDHRLQSENLQAALMEILTRELALTPDQIQRVRPIVARASEEYRNVTLDTVQRVTQLVQAANQRIARELTPAQAEKLRQLEEERQALVRQKLNPDYLKHDFLSP